MRARTNADLYECGLKQREMMRFATKQTAFKIEIFQVLSLSNSRFHAKSSD